VSATVNDAVAVLWAGFGSACCSEVAAVSVAVPGAVIVVKSVICPVTLG
jgi:hypothetical protein